MRCQHGEEVDTLCAEYAGHRLVLLAWVELEQRAERRGGKQLLTHAQRRLARGRLRFHRGGGGAPTAKYGNQGESPADDAKFSERVRACYISPFVS